MQRHRQRGGHGAAYALNFFCFFLRTPKIRTRIITHSALLTHVQMRSVPIFLLVAFACTGALSCLSTCPTSTQKDGVIYSSKPSFFIAEYSIEQRGNLCCTCALNCSYTGGCVAHICAADNQRWIGFGGERVDCQLFGATSPEPSESTSLATFYGWQCTP